jgi:PAS domain-containing protein
LIPQNNIAWSDLAMTPNPVEPGGPGALPKPDLVAGHPREELQVVHTKNKAAKVDPYRDAPSASPIWRSRNKLVRMAVLGRAKEGFGVAMRASGATTPTGSSEEGRSKIIGNLAGGLANISHAFWAFLQGDARFREIIEALPAAIYTTDATGRITFYNETAAAMWPTFRSMSLHFL